MKKEIVYLYTFKNGKYYVGKTCEPDKRCLNYKAYTKKQIIYKALKKAKKNGDRVDLRYISRYETPEVAAGIEKFFVAYYRANINRYGDEFGYNLTDGGEGVCGWKATEKQRTKQSISQTKKWEDTEYRTKQVAAMMGKKIPPRTAEWRAKVSARMTGDRSPTKRHEVRVLMSLTRQLHYYEKKLIFLPQDFLTTHKIGV